MFCQSSLACDWTTIKKTPDGFLYSTECHLKVGQLVKNEALYKQQVDELNQALSLKDLALTKADERIRIWRDESYKQYEFNHKYQSFSDTQKIIYFSLGIVFTGIAVYVAGQLK